MFLKIIKYVRNLRGQSMVEFALVAPIFLLLVFGVIDFGQLFNRMITVNQASREAARVAAVSGDVAKAKNAAKNYGNDLTCTISPSSLVSGSNVTVTVSSSVTISTPLISALFSSNPVDVTGQSVMQVE